MVFLALELAGPWVVLGFSVSMEAFDELLSIMFPGVRSSLVFSGFGLEPPASGFQSYSYSSLKTSPSIQHTNDKTSRLKMKSFSTVRDTQRCSQSYMEKRRGRREIEVTRRRRGGIKRGESNLACNQFPMCSLQSGTLREVHRVT